MSGLLVHISGLSISRVFSVLRAAFEVRGLTRLILYPCRQRTANSADILDAMLLDEIIELAIDDQQSIAVLLRKCIVLGHQLKNERLKVWANKELDGYSADDVDLPLYRVTPAQAKGNFNGPFGSMLNDFPIPPAILEDAHRGLASDFKLTQGVTAYEKLVRSSNSDQPLTVPWPTNFVLYYQRRIPNNKGLILHHAYQEIAMSSLVELLDTVRNRVLNLALEIKSEVGENGADLRNISRQIEKKIDQTVTQNIYAGNVYVGGAQSTFNIQHQSIVTGDWEQMRQILSDSGISQREIGELSDAVKRDGKGMGSSVTAWIKKTAPSVTSNGIRIGASIGQALLTDFLKQHLGIHS